MCHVSYGMRSCVNSSWGQMCSNAIYLGFQGKTFQQPWKVLPAGMPATRPRTSWTNYLLKVAAWKRRKSRRPVRTPALPHLLLNAPALASLMSMLLLTWVFPRARAPFELCLLDSSRLLLLWPSETRLLPCPGSERENSKHPILGYYHHYSQQIPLVEKWWNQLRAKEID